MAQIIRREKKSSLIYKYDNIILHVLCAGLTLYTVWGRTDVNQIVKKTMSIKIVFENRKIKKYISMTTIVPDLYSLKKKIYKYFL